MIVVGVRIACKRCLSKNAIENLPVNKISERRKRTAENSIPATKPRHMCSGKRVILQDLASTRPMSWTHSAEAEIGSRELRRLRLISFQELLYAWVCLLNRYYGDGVPSCEKSLLQNVVERYGCKISGTLLEGVNVVGLSGRLLRGVTHGIHVRIYPWI